jgi:F0F1-type ATP synthase gamma subunit
LPTGEVDIVKIAYQNFISTFEQRPTIRTVFPLSLGELEAVVGDIVPARGVFAEAVKMQTHHPHLHDRAKRRAKCLNAILAAPCLNFCLPRAA